LQYKDRLSTTLDIGGIINVTSGVQTTANQNYSTDRMNIVADSRTSATTFKSNQTGQINFDVSKVGGQFNVNGTGRMIIDGETNFTGSGIGLTGVSLPVQEARAAAAASSGGNLANTLKLNKLVKLSAADSPSGEVTVAMDGTASETSKTKTVDCAEEDKLLECK
jgi:hypothetical protein